MSARVAVLIVSWNAVRQGHAADLIASLRNVDYPSDRWAVFIGDNGSDDGSAAMFSAEFPEATVVSFEENLGFAEANNRLAELALAQGFDYAYLLNQDCTTDPLFLRRAVEMLQSDPTIGTVQSRIFLHQSPDRLNTIANAIHFLGFGFSIGSYRLAANFARDAWNGREIAYASGAGMMLRLDLVRQAGLFERAFYIYHEDLDFGWKARLLGYRNVCAFDSVIYHKYTFSKDARKFYYLERNRCFVLLENLRVGTLLLILPALVGFEIGLLGYAWRAGFLRAKWESYGYFCRWAHCRELLARRKFKQARRVTTDRAILRVMSATIGSPDIEHPLLRHIANPCLRVYFAFIRLVVFW